MNHIASQPQPEPSGRRDKVLVDRGFRLTGYVAELCRRERVNGAITIDSVGASFADSALFASQSAKTPQGKTAAWKLEMLVADVPSAIQPYSTLDRLAFEKRSTHYSENKPNVYLYPVNILSAVCLSRGEPRLAVRISLWLDEQFEVIESTVHPVTAQVAAALSDKDVHRVLKNDDHPYYEVMNALTQISVGLASRRNPIVRSYDPLSGLYYHQGVLRCLEPNQLLPRIIRTETALLVNEYVARQMSEANLPFPYLAQGESILTNDAPPKENPLSALVIGLSSPKSPSFFSDSPRLHTDLGSLYCRVTSPLRNYAAVLALSQLKALHGLGEARKEEEVSNFCARSNPSVCAANSHSGELVIHRSRSFNLTEELTKMSKKEFHAIILAAVQASKNSGSRLPTTEIAHATKERLQSKQIWLDTLITFWKNKYVFVCGETEALTTCFVNQLLYSKPFSESLYKRIFTSPSARTVTITADGDLFKAEVISSPPGEKAYRAWATSEDHARHGAQILATLYSLGLNQAAVRLFRAQFRKSSLRVRLAKIQEANSGDGCSLEQNTGECGLFALRHARRQGYITTLKVESTQVPSLQELWETTVKIYTTRCARPLVRETGRAEDKNVARSIAARRALRSLVLQGLVPPSFLSLESALFVERPKRSLQGSPSEVSSAPMLPLLREVLELHSTGSSHIFLKTELELISAVSLNVVGGLVVPYYLVEQDDPSKVLNELAIAILRRLDGLGFSRDSGDRDYTAQLSSLHPRELGFETCLVDRQFRDQFAQAVVYPQARGQELSLFCSVGESEYQCSKRAAASVLEKTAGLWASETDAIYELYVQGRFIEGLNLLQRACQPRGYATLLLSLPQSGLQFYETSCRFVQDSVVLTTAGRGPSEEVARRAAARKMCRLLELEPSEPWEHDDPGLHPRSFERSFTMRLFYQENRSTLPRTGDRRT